MNRFLFLKDSGNKWIFIVESVEKSKDFVLILLKKVGSKVKFIGSKRLYQEVSFVEAHMRKEGIEVLYPSCYSLKIASTRFRLFLEKEMGRHTLFLILLLIFLPFTAIAGIFPGPNIFFYSNISFLYLFFRAMKGIKVLLKNAKLIPDETLGKWEKGDKKEVLDKIKEKFFLEKPEILID
ncbi:MAG: hypothetical protein ACUVUG_01400 [Candidatus Aminicenantia bacterium]